MKINIQELLFRPSVIQEDTIAIVAKDGTLTYGELKKYAAGIAKLIRENLPVQTAGESPDVCIGVCMDRNKALLPAVLAIWHLGATYLPLDPELPDSRKQYMLEDGDVCLVLTDSIEKVAGLSGLPKLLIDLKQIPESKDTEYKAANPDDCAYIIYTSGTTGYPKGVQISYANLSAFTGNMIHRKACGLGFSQYKYLAFASISFDASILEWMMCLPAGGTLVLAGKEERKDISSLIALMKHERINVAFLPPSLLALFPDLSFPDLKILLFGAEAIHEKLSGRLKQQPYRLINAYGPTENTVVSTLRIVEKDTPSDNIGFPLQGVIYYVLDERAEPVKAGNTGELYLGGAQKSKGYKGKEELNKQAFISYRGENLYKTGDLVQQLPDGSLRFIGRKDSQVKIRGFRIELNEIMQQLEKDPEVEKSYVKVIQQNGRQLLGAYIQPIDHSRFCLEKVKERLRNQLPYYMIPNQWQVVEKFSRTLNDKIDARCLPPFQIKEEHYVPPVHPGEHILCHILKNMLGVAGVSVEANFTNDLGMTSLDILNFVRLANEQGCRIQTAAVYAAGNVRQLLNAPLQQPVYWYREQRPGYPVLILICGAAYFNHLYLPFAEQLYKKYDLLVIDAIYDHFLKVAKDTSGLLAYYARAVCSQVQERPVYALTGFCVGTELALGLAELLRRTVGKQWKVIALDGQAWINHAFYEYYPLLIFPGDKPEAIRKRNEIIQLYFQTTPNLIYQGEVVVFLSGLFHQQAGLSPDEPWTEEHYRIFREEYEQCEKLWKKYYPHVSVFRLPADHWSFFQGASLEQLVSFFLKQ